MTAVETCCDSPKYERDGKLWCLNAYCLNSYWRQGDKDASEISQYIWDHITGRDSEGTAYSVHRLIDGSGRVIAKVVDPEVNCYDYRAYFHLEKEMDEANPDLRFIDVGSAKRFVLEKLAERAAKPATAEPAETPAKEEAPTPA